MITLFFLILKVKIQILITENNNCGWKVEYSYMVYNTNERYSFFNSMLIKEFSFKMITAYYIQWHIINMWYWNAEYFIINHWKGFIAIKNQAKILKMRIWLVYFFWQPSKWINSKWIYSNLKQCLSKGVKCREKWNKHFNYEL